MTPQQLSEKFEKEWGSRLNHNLWHFYELKCWIEENAEKMQNEKIESLLDDIQDCFSQACEYEGKYDHGCLSAYEMAQRTLIEAGRIKEEDCLRK